jgi:hypothetical protein
MLRCATAIAACSLLSPGLAGAQDQGLPTTTLSCADFKKNPDGNWVVVNDRPFRVGSTLATINDGTIIKPKSAMIAGSDMYALLEATCSAPAKPG